VPSQYRPAAEAYNKYQKVLNEGNMLVKYEIGADQRENNTEGYLNRGDVDDIAEPVGSLH
jgi:hypothetical protein